MSQIRSFDDALDFYPAGKASLRARFVAFFQGVRLVLAALAEGHAAARRYHELTARGMSHDQAAGRIFSDHYR